jgi:GNAT superfamily N-acetyltransferase
MLEISYIKLNDDIEKKLFEKYNWIYKYNCIPKYEGCYNIAAIIGDEVVGCATLGPQKWTPPLDNYCDVFIHWINVDKQFQRKGIGRHLVNMLESWAKENGYRQIRAWSNEQAVEALHMWYALNYAMCPAVEVIYNSEGQIDMIVKGYRYAKILNPTSENNTTYKNANVLPQAWG